ncbi:MAG: mercury(II) reductase [Conexivisphaera sp.]
MRDEYDLVILGWGAAAFSAAIRASELTSGQASIAMIGRGPLGGTCVNVGCVPSKYLIDASAEVHRPTRPRYPGIGPAGPSVDFAALMRSLRESVREERKLKYEDVVAGYGNVELVEGTAAFSDDRTVLVRTSGGGTLRVRGYNFLIATGSSPAVPGIRGLEDAGYLTSDTIWGLDAVPGRLVVIGGGAIGVELGQALSRLGSHVTILEGMHRIVPRAEPEMSDALRRALEDEGIDVRTDVRIASISRVPGGVELNLADGPTIETDAILVATGRRANALGLNLEAAGVEYSRRGIRVDGTMRTTNPRIYAAGDVVDSEFNRGLMLETLAAREGIVAVENIYEHSGRSVDPLTFPWAVFSDPQLASVGLTREQCSKEVGDCRHRSIGVEMVPRGRILREDIGSFEVIASPTGRIVGVHALSSWATEFVAEGAMAMRLGLTVDDLVDVAHVFPTLSEGIKLAAQSFRRDISRMSCCME